MSEFLTPILDFTDRFFRIKRLLHQSANEMELLKTLYQDENVQCIADKLGRPVQATRVRIFKLGLKKRRPAKKD